MPELGWGRDWTSCLGGDRKGRSSPVTIFGLKKGVFLGFMAILTSVESEIAYFFRTTLSRYPLLRSLAEPLKIQCLTRFLAEKID